MSDLLNKIYDNFYKTVIFDNRYELILEGLKNTIIISLGALAIGILIGAIISIIRYTNKHTGKFKLLNAINKLDECIVDISEMFRDVFIEFGKKVDRDELENIQNKKCS